METPEYDNLLNNFIDIIRKNTIGYIKIHTLITKGLIDHYKIDLDTLEPVAAGANGIVLKAGSMYIKIAHAQVKVNKRGRDDNPGYQKPEEKTPDKMLLESITSNAVKKYSVIAGIDYAWQLPQEMVKPLFTRLGRPSGKYTLYNTALITEPTVPSTTLRIIRDTTVKHIFDITATDEIKEIYKQEKKTREEQLQLHTDIMRCNKIFINELISQQTFINFLTEVLKVGYETGFVHNDLHGNNILAVLSEANTITGYKIIDLGRAYCRPLEKTPNQTSIYRNEFAKLFSIEKGKTVNLSDLNRAIPINCTIDDCIKYVDRPDFIKTRQSNDFESQTYILFDIIGLLNGIKYFEDFTPQHNIKDWLTQEPPNIYNLINYWYQNYISSCDIKQTERYFYDNFWIDTLSFNTIKTHFYETIDKAKVTDYINKLISASGGNSSTPAKKRSKSRSISIMGTFTPVPYGTLLMEAMDTKPTPLPRRSSARQYRPDVTALPYLPPAIPVYGGKKQKSPSNNPKPDGPSRLDPRHNKNQTPKPTFEPTPDPSTKQTKTPKQPQSPTPHQIPRKRPLHRPHPRSASPETPPPPLPRRKTKTHQSQN